MLRVFARGNAIDEHLNRKHGWPGVKRSAENQEGGGAAKRQKLAEEDPSNYYNIEKVGEKKIERFRSTATYYKAKIRDVEKKRTSKHTENIKVNISVYSSRHLTNNT